MDICYFLKKPDTNKSSNEEISESASGVISAIVLTKGKVHDILYEGHLEQHRCFYTHRFT